MTPPARLFGRDPRDAQLFERLDLGLRDGEGGGGALLRPPLTIRPGDKLRVTCAYDTTSRAAPTPAGWGHGDEMCNLYLMVHAEAPAFCSCSGSKTDRPTRFAITGAPEGGNALSRGGRFA